VSAPARVSAGSGASSGQFAPTQHAEPDIALDDELDDEICSHCGEDAGGGDGYDGFCGNCADLVDQHDEGEHSARNDRCPMCAG
jgi:hypothetical protein